MRGVSGAYRHILANSCLVGGVRTTYMELLNRAILAARGTDLGLHVANMPSLTLLYLMSFLTTRGYSTKIVNFFNREHDNLATLLEEDPLVVAITTTYYAEPSPVSEIVQFVRRHNSDAVIVAGGPYIYEICSCNDVPARDHLLARIGADFYVVENQGELTLSRVLNELRKGSLGHLETVPNLVYAGGDGGYVTTRRELEDNDLDKDDVNWRALDPVLYTPVVSVRTSRGCAFRCSFCRTPRLTGRLALASVDTVMHGLQALVEAGVKSVILIDDTANVPLPRFKEICRRIKSKRWDLVWSAYFRCSDADSETYDLMAESRCQSVCLGIESGSPEMLKRMNKKACLDKYRDGIRRLKERGIVTLTGIVVGFPGETQETVDETIRFIQDTSPAYYYPQLFFYDPLSPLHERAGEFSLKGQGYSWTHASMDWREASDAVEKMYRSVESSYVLPVHSFGFSGLPYVLSKGIGAEELWRFAGIAQELIIDGLSSGADSSDRYEARLRDVFRPATA